MVRGDGRGAGVLRCGRAGLDGGWPPAIESRSDCGPVRVALRVQHVGRTSRNPACSPRWGSQGHVPHPVGGGVPCRRCQRDAWAAVNRRPLPTFRHRRRSTWSARGWASRSARLRRPSPNPGMDAGRGLCLDHRHRRECPMNGAATEREQVGYYGEASSLSSCEAYTVCAAAKRESCHL